eukprot:TRINITY_DN18696_c0_g1_i2.p1 TRINITY_DN18696_c0_g1~~TRINITY_DN18696_c0_g1_i2.p1  ORF type:complete len:261 (+),score=8.03 TRINITY_DN18696_c0_g1_i2:194-976(+)
MHGAITSLFFVLTIDVQSCFRVKRRKGAGCHTDSLHDLQGSRVSCNESVTHELTLSDSLATHGAVPWVMVAAALFILVLLMLAVCHYGGVQRSDAIAFEKSEAEEHQAQENTVHSVSSGNGLAVLSDALAGAAEYEQDTLSEDSGVQKRAIPTLQEDVPRVFSNEPSGEHHAKTDELLIHNDTARFSSHQDVPGGSKDRPRDGRGHEGAGHVSGDDGENNSSCSGHSEVERTVSRMADSKFWRSSHLSRGGHDEADMVIM